MCGFCVDLCVCVFGAPPPLQAPVFQDIAVRHASERADTLAFCIVASTAPLPRKKRREGLRSLHASGGKGEWRLACCMCGGGERNGTATFPCAPVDWLNQAFGSAAQLLTGGPCGGSVVVVGGGAAKT